MPREVSSALRLRMRRCTGSTAPSRSRHSRSRPTPAGRCALPPSRAAARLGSIDRQSRSSEKCRRTRGDGVGTVLRSHALPSQLQRNANRQQSCKRTAFMQEDSTPHRARTHARTHRHARVRTRAARAIREGSCHPTSHTQCGNVTAPRLQAPLPEHSAPADLGHTGASQCGCAIRHTAQLALSRTGGANSCA